MNDYERLSKLINTLETREAVYALVQSEPSLKLKKDITRFAKLLGCHITNDDKRSKIEDKIVECVVGYRLRSEAIRSVNLKR